MRLSTLLGVKKTTSISSNIVTIGVIIFGLLSLGFGVVTFYGMSTGTFVLSSSGQATQKGIQLSEDISFTNGTSRLYADPKPNSEETTYSYLKIEEARQKDGTYVDNMDDYLAYTFYLRNSGNEMIDLVYNISILEVTENLDDYIRLLVIIDHLDGNVEETMFMKPDPVGHKGYPEEVFFPTTKLFVSESLITNERIMMFQVGQIKKISIFMWIEGYDTDENFKGGNIKIDMKFDILNAG
jgi:hypothetical protein